MTNSYYDDQYDQYEDDYVDDQFVEAEQNQFYEQEATFAPRTDADVWPQRSLARLVGTLLWGVSLFGVVAGTIWWFDILPTPIPEKPLVVADDLSGEMKITPKQINQKNNSEKVALSNPFEEMDRQNNVPVFPTESETDDDNQTQVVEATYTVDTPQQQAHRQRELPAPKELLSYKETQNKKWDNEKTSSPNATQQPPQMPVEKQSPASGIIQVSGEKTAEFIKSPVPLTDPMLSLTAIDTLLKAGKELDAHRELSKIYWEQPAARPQIMNRIESTAKAIFISRQKHYTAPYVVEAGDQLIKIAQNYYIPWQYLARLNRTNPKNIRPGQKLKVIKGPFAAIIDLSNYELTIHAHGYFVKRYEIGIGKGDSTPLGTFKVLNKLENPTYYGPNGNVIKADASDNPLGERWIDLGDSYGIHGTIDPNSIGKAKSRGCIRMHNKDVEEVYDFLGVGSVVKIQK